MYIKKFTNEAINRYLKIVFVFIVILALISLVIGLTSGSYLSHAGKKTYKPDVESGHGFEGRANTLLAKLLLDTVEGNVYSISDINKHYKSLRFYKTNVEGTDLINQNSIRLEYIIPQEEEDKNFYFNSYLSDILKAQKNNISSAYFKIKFNNQTLRIESITVEPNLYNLVLKTNKNENRFPIANPYRDLDKKALFVVNNLATIPLFAGNASFWKHSSQHLRLQLNTNFIDTLNNLGAAPGRFEPVSRTKDLYLYAKSNRAIGFQIKGASSEIRFFNIEGNFEFDLKNFEKVIKVDKRGKETSCTQSTLNKIKRNDLPIKLLCYSKNHIYNEFKITDKLDSELDIIKWSGNSVNSDLFTKQTITALNTIDENKINLNDKITSINPLLTKCIENELKLKAKQLKNQYPKDIIQISMALMDVKTGELLAAPYYSTEFADKNFNFNEVKNYNFTKHFIGSTFKPLISNAASVVFPKIGSFNLTNSAFSIDTNSRKCAILGYPFNIIPFSKNGLMWRPCNGRVDYLANSEDLYPIVQTMLAMTEKGDGAFNRLISDGFIDNLKDLNNNQCSRFVPFTSNTKIREIENSTFVNCVSDLYAVANENYSSNNYHTFVQLYDSVLLGVNPKYIPSAILPEHVTLNSNLLGNINLNDKYNNQEFTSLTSWILGQGSNEWTNIHLAQAYARLFSKKDVYMTLWHNQKNTLKNISTSHTFGSNQIDYAWTSFLDDFKLANTKGILLPPVQSTFNNALAKSSTYIDNDLVIVGKTGTPDNFQRRTIYIDRSGNKQFFDEGLFAFGILSNYNTNNTKGVVGVIYVKRVSGTKPSGNGIQSKDARDVLSENLLSNILFFTQKKY